MTTPPLATAPDPGPIIGIDRVRQARRFMMSADRLAKGEAISLLSVGVDFGVTQVVNGNKGAHAIIKKSLFDRPAS
jgi:acetamidase/formamidase